MQLLVRIYRILLFMWYYCVILLNVFLIISFFNKNKAYPWFYFKQFSCRCISRKFISKGTLIFNWLKLKPVLPHEQVVIWFEWVKWQKYENLCPFPEEISHVWQLHGSYYNQCHAIKFCANGRMKTCQYQPHQAAHARNIDLGDLGWSRRTVRLSQSILTFVLS